MKAAIIRPDGRFEFKDLEDFSDIQTEVGGTAQPVGGKIDGEDDLTFWGNEDGKPLGMEMNEAATGLWWLTNPAAFRRDHLVGTVVVTGTVSDYAELMSLSEDAVAFLTEMFNEED